MKKYKVIVWGLGNMGSGMVKVMNKKSNIFEVIGGIDKRICKDKSFIEKLNIDASKFICTDKPEDLIKESNADIVLLNINSFTKEIINELKMIAKAKMNCITIAEEMAYPWIQSKEIADTLDAIAKENDITILGTGINPGFVLDTLIIALTAVCTDVKKIEASRINDLSPFGKTVMETQGVGTTVEEFENGIKKGLIVGHVGFPESIAMIFEAMGWELGKIDQIREPIISKTFRETPDVKVKPGMVAGCKHIGIGYDKNGIEKVKLIHPQQIHPGKEDIDTGDYINIVGEPAVSMSIKPEIPGGIGTIAMAINMIPHVINAKSGLLAMLDLPIPHALMQ